MNQLDLTGGITETHTLTLPEEALDTLRAEGHESPPATITLFLRECTNGERRRFEAELATTRGADAEIAMLARALMRRAAPGTDVKVLMAYLDESSSTARAQLSTAYLLGYMPDPKPLARTLSRVQGANVKLALNNLEATLNEESETSPSSPGTTASNPGSSTDSP